LSAILVARAKKHIQSAFFTTAGRRRQQVIRFIPCHAQHRHVHGVEHLPDHGNLHAQIFRHRRPACLVLCEDFITKRRPGHIERTDEIVRLLLQSHKQQIASESIKGVGRQTRRAAHFRYRMEHLENERKCIKHEQASWCRTG
jgi:hypothetical protein